jgi:hypothetical protein
MAKPTIISVDGEPTQREILHTFLYGKFAHSNEYKRETLQSWKTMQPNWDVAYLQVESILSKFVFTVSLMKELNERVLKNYSNLA